jgi:hypothetical protein
MVLVLKWSGGLWRRYTYREALNATSREWILAKINETAQEYHVNATGNPNVAAAGDVGTDVSYNNSE